MTHSSMENCRGAYHSFHAVFTVYGCRFTVQNVSFEMLQSFNCKPLTGNCKLFMIAADVPEETVWEIPESYPRRFPGRRYRPWPQRTCQIMPNRSKSFPVLVDTLLLA